MSSLQVSPLALSAFLASARSGTRWRVFLQTVNMGQAWHCCSVFLVGTWFGGRTSKATFLAAPAPHTRDWLLALPISA